MGDSVVGCHGWLVHPCERGSDGVELVGVPTSAGRVPSACSHVVTRERIDHSRGEALADKPTSGTRRRPGPLCLQRSSPSHPPIKDRLDVKRQDVCDMLPLAAWPNHLHRIPVSSLCCLIPSTPSQHKTASTSLRVRLDHHQRRHRSRLLRSHIHFPSVCNPISILCDRSRKGCCEIRSEPFSAFATTE